MKSAGASHGTVRSCASKWRPENIGPKTSGPQIAPETAPKRTNDIPRARRSGGNISAAAARESRTIDCAGAAQPEPEEDEHARAASAAGGGDERADDAEREAAADHRHPAEPVGEPARRADRERTGDQEHRRPEPEDAVDAGDRDDRDRAERDGELDHPGLADEPEREQERVPPRPSFMRAIRARSAARRTRAAPPWDGCRTYVAAERGVRDPADGDDPPADGELVARTPRPAATSAGVGRRFDVSVPGWVGTTFQSRTSSATPSSASTRWTIVAVASAGPRP